MVAFQQLVAAIKEKVEGVIKLEHLIFRNEGDIPFASITLPHSKVHYPSLPELIICYTGTDICPFTALFELMTKRLSDRYAKESAVLFSPSDGAIALKQ